MRDFSLLEMEFLDEAKILPEEYVEHFLPPLQEIIIIPGRNGRVGDLEINILQPFIAVQVGNHTEARFVNVKGTMEFIKKVVSDKVVFYFGKDGVDYFNFDDFENMSEADEDYHVWSGPFQSVYLDKLFAH